jgi:putative oxidoreductase
MAETGRGLRIAVWVVSGLLTALYLLTGFLKVSSNPQAVEGFTKYGYSDAFRFFIGACELAGAIGIWIPKLSFWAAAGLIVIMLGAVYTHVTYAEAPTGPIGALVMLGFVAWSRRNSALFLS